MFKKYDPRKAAGLVAAVFSAFIVLFLLLLYFMNQRVKVIDVSDCDRNTENVVFHLEEVGTFYDYISIAGYAYIPGENIEDVNIQVLAHDTEHDVYYRLPTEIIKREDITEQVNDGNNYDYSGFKSIVYKRKISDEFKIAILYQCNGRKILIDSEEIE